jgi:hypothetical protein
LIGLALIVLGLAVAYSVLRRPRALALLALLALTGSAQATEHYLGKVSFFYRGNSETAPYASLVSGTVEIEPAPIGTYDIQLRHIGWSYVSRSKVENFSSLGSSPAMNHVAQLKHIVRHVGSDLPLQFVPQQTSLTPIPTLSPFDGVLDGAGTSGYLWNVGYGVSWPTDPHCWDIAEWQTTNANGKHELRGDPFYTFDWSEDFPGHAWYPFWWWGEVHFEAYALTIP